jgi:hypothetical protein
LKVEPSCYGGRVRPRTTPYPHGIIAEDTVGCTIDGSQDAGAVIDGNPEWKLQQLQEVKVAMRERRCLIRFNLAISVVLFILPAACAAQGSSSEITAPKTGSATLHNEDEERFKLPPNALEVARLINVEPAIARLSRLTGTKDLSAGPGASLEALLLRQQITDAVVAASLNVDSVLDEIDNEREQTEELRNVLRSQRDRAIGTTNVAVLAVGTGLGIVSGVLQVSKTTSTAGNAIGFAAGGISTLFSIRGLRQVRGGKRPAWVLPNMLAAFVGQPGEQHNQYPDDIWAYLNGVPPGGASQATRREQMLAEWVAEGRIGNLDSPQSKRKIMLLISTNAADKNLKTELLNERAAMLADVRNRVALMKHDLRDLMRGLRP